MKQWPSNRKSINVGIIEEDARIRALYRASFDDADGFTCCASWPGIQQAIDAYVAEIPNVILLSIRQASSKPTVRRISGLKKKYATSDIIILIVEENHQAVFEAFCAGATGYMIKGIAPAQLLARVRDIHSGGGSICAGIARRIKDVFKTHRDTNAIHLTILDLLCSGESHGAIALKLHLSGQALKAHFRSISIKLHEISQVHHLA